MASIADDFVSEPVPVPAKFRPLNDLSVSPAFGEPTLLFETVIRMVPSALKLPLSAAPRVVGTLPLELTVPYSYVACPPAVEVMPT